MELSLWIFFLYQYQNFLSNKHLDHKDPIVATMCKMSNVLNFINENESQTL